METARLKRRRPSSRYRSIWRTRTTRGGLAIVIATIFLLVTAPPANAHYIYESGHVHWTSDQECTWARAEISHNSTNERGGYVKSSVALDYAWITPTGNFACAIQVTALAGYLATKYQYWKWSGSKWYICAQSAYHYNPSAAHKYEIYWRWSSPPCGNGYYGNLTYSYIKKSGVWLGGDIWSGYHWIG